MIIANNGKIKKDRFGYFKARTKQDENGHVGSTRKVQNACKGDPLIFRQLFGEFYTSS